MSYCERRTTDDSIEFKIDGYDVAKFQDSGNGMEGQIFEGNHPFERGGGAIRLSASDMIALAAWLLTKAEQRASDTEMRAEDSEEDRADA